MALVERGRRAAAAAASERQTAVIAISCGRCGGGAELSAVPTLDNVRVMAQELGGSLSASGARESRRRSDARCGALRTRAASIRIGIMANALLVALSAHLLVGATNGKPPRLAACREVLKAKDATEIFAVSQSYSCQNVTFPCGSTPTYYADTRNCENYYQCTLMTLLQCPCPLGTTFNVQTQQCDNTSSPCDCAPPTTTAAPSTTPSTTTAAPTQPVAGLPASGSALPPAAAGATARSVATAIKDVVEVVADGDGTTAAAAAHSTGASGNVDAAIVVPAIVFGCATLVAVVVIFAFLHARGYIGHRKQMKPSQPPGGCPTASGTVDRHVYAEIDETLVNGQILWSQQNIINTASLPPPPPPPPPPPVAQLPQAGGASESVAHFYPPYHHHHHPASAVPVTCGTLNGLHFASLSGAGSVKRAFPMTNPHLRSYDRSQMPPPQTSVQHHHVPIQPQLLPWFDIPGGGGHGGGIGNNGGCAAPLPRAAAGDGVSECSQCSACSSNQASLDASDSDMHTPLNAASSGQRGKIPYMSKQVYI